MVVKGNHLHIHIIAHVAQLRTVLQLKDQFCLCIPVMILLFEVLSWRNLVLKGSHTLFYPNLKPVPYHLKQFNEALPRRVSFV